jgi:hypothetical protein
MILLSKWGLRAYYPLPLASSILSRYLLAILLGKERIEIEEDAVNSEKKTALRYSSPAVKTV